MFSSAPRDPVQKDAYRPRDGIPFDLRRIAVALHRHRSRLLSLSMAAMAIGIIVGKFVIPKNYSATATVLWMPAMPSGGLASGGDGYGEAETAMPSLLASITLPGNMLRVMERTDRMGGSIDGMIDRLSISSVDLSTIINISAKSKTPDDAVKLANTTAEVFIEERRNVKRRHFIEVADALRAILAQRELAVSEARARFDRFRDENNIKSLSSQEQDAINELAHLETEEHDARIAIESTKGSEASLARSQLANPETMILSRSESRSDIERVGTLQTELAQARARFSEDHPAVRALATQLDALKAEIASRNKPNWSNQTQGRNSTYDSIQKELEESHASRASLDERRHELARVHAEVDARARVLTKAEAEAARLWAEVAVDEGDVSERLHDIAVADEDIRGATSDFQFVSRAIPPLHASSSKASSTAIAIPTFVALAAVFWWVAPWILKTSSEVAFWTHLPVVWSASWPFGPHHEAEELAREVAHVIEEGGGVVGFTAMRDDGLALELVHAVAERLRARGVTCAVLESPQPELGVTAAHAIERSEVGEQLEELRANHTLVLFALPSVYDSEAVRAARRWIDSIIILVPSGEHSVNELARLKQTIGVTREAVAGIAVIGVDEVLLASRSRSVGDSRIFATEASEPRAV